MPVDINLKQKPIYQRAQYDKGGIGRIYWNYRDKLALSCIGERDARVVDVGCGEGVTLEKVSRLYPEKCCIGVDGLKENLFICRAHRLAVMGGDVYQLPIKNESVDYILLLEVIEHLSDPEKAIVEMRRILRPMGKLVMVFPNDAVFKIARILTLRLKEAFYDPGHITQWTPGAAKELANRHGFKVIERKSIPFFIWRFSLHHLLICEKENGPSA
ncbi:MAG: class I SAM-dependent methyltransferase [Syntrophales bacterium]|nr:class I SAM-dependent methyltransferase [Syntrophales bacterium]